MYYQKTLISTFIFLLMFSGSAFSASNHIYSALSCIYKTPHLSSSYNYDGTLMNTSSSLARVYCPVNRNQTLSRAGIKSAWISVKAQHGTENIKCWIMRNRPSGENYSSTWIKGETRRSTPIWVPIDFGALSESYRKTSYTIQCNLPAVDNNKQSGVGSYHIEEA